MPAYSIGQGAAVAFLHRSRQRFLEITYHHALLTRCFRYLTLLLPLFHIYAPLRFLDYIRFNTFWPDSIYLYYAYFLFL